jgi:adenine phosphoribosyltransferase
MDSSIERAMNRAPDAALAEDLRRAIRDVPDFPKPGVLFKDITPVLLDPVLLQRVIDALATPFADTGITHVMAIESRGFILGAPVALRLGAGLVPVRKQGKLPHARIRETYALEYGTDCVEVHADALKTTPAPRVLVVDDVLATGGTAAAACRLGERLDARIEGITVLLDLSMLSWKQTLAGRQVHSLLSF